ncbi:hypothetical protein, partial [Enterovibrio norvegicus]|uniref:hypothetical protein n=1 Tax=Enterovibrio norvegicus TaxID=188144 RepID=UPI001C6122C4
ASIYVPICHLQHGVGQVRAYQHKMVVTNGRFMVRYRSCSDKMSVQSKLVLFMTVPECGLLLLLYLSIAP